MGIKKISKLIVFMACLILLQVRLVYAHNSSSIYLDYQATTPVDPLVIGAMMPYFIGHYGNPHSSSHDYGKMASAGVERARERIAQLIGAKTNDIIFTSGATESNNIAILGASRALKKKTGKNRIITAITEHKAVLETAKSLEKEGFEVVLLHVKQDGLIDLEELKQALNDKTVLVSIMTVNNEIGVIQPIKEIGEVAHQHGALFHTDAAQGFGKIPIDVEKDNIDLLSVSGHKIYGPKGVGVLYAREGVDIEPLFYGGGQEKSIRPGTLPVPLCVGLGKAAQLAKIKMEQSKERTLSLQKRFLEHFDKHKIDYVIHGDLVKRIPGNVNVSFKGVEACDLLPMLPKLAISIGSACSSSKTKDSYVVRALNPDPQYGKTSLRIGFGRFTAAEEIDFAAKNIIDNVQLLQEKANNTNNKKHDMAKIEDKISDLSGKYKLIFAYKGGCPYCHLFAPIVKKVAKKYNWEIIPISSDGGVLEDFPNAVIDFSVVKKYGLKYFPTLLAEEYETKKIVTVANGAILDEQDLLIQLASIGETGPDTNKKDNQA